MNKICLVAVARTERYRVAVRTAPFPLPLVVCITLNYAAVVRERRLGGSIIIIIIIGSNNSCKVSWCSRYRKTTAISSSLGELFEYHRQRHHLFVHTHATQGYLQRKVKALPVLHLCGDPPFSDCRRHSSGQARTASFGSENRQKSC